MEKKLVSEVRKGGRFMRKVLVVVIMATMLFTVPAFALFDDNSTNQQQQQGIADSGNSNNSNSNLATGGAGGNACQGQGQQQGQQQGQGHFRRKLPVIQSKQEK